MSAALAAALFGADAASARVAYNGGGSVGAAAGEATGVFIGGDILSWNLTLAGLLGSPFNLHPSNSVVYLQGSQVSAIGSDVTFHYNGNPGGEESENSLFDGNHGCSPSDWLCFQEKTAPDNIFEAAARSASDIQFPAPNVPAAPEPSAWALMLIGFATLGLLRFWLRMAQTSA